MEDQTQPADVLVVYWSTSVRYLCACQCWIVWDHAHTYAHAVHVQEHTIILYGHNVYAPELTQQDSYKLMYMYMYICACICIYIYTYTHIYVYTYKYMYIYICVHTYTYMHIEYTYIHTYLLTYLLIYMHTCMIKSYILDCSRTLSSNTHTRGKHLLLK